MKKNFVLLLCAVAAMFATVACDEANSTSEGTIQGIFTVDRNFLYPELQDTFYRVNPSDISAFELEDGDRAQMILEYKIDNVLGNSSLQWNIKSVNGMLPVSGLTAVEDVDTMNYASPISGLYEMLLMTPTHIVQGGLMVAADWYWKKKQNFNLFFYGNGSTGDFKLSPLGLSKDTLCFSLNSKIAQGEEPTIQLVTFDLSKVSEMLPAKDAELLVKLDSFYINVTTKVLNDNAIEKWTFSNGRKYKNDL